jgi:hypothetical protein
MAGLGGVLPAAARGCDESRWPDKKAGFDEGLLSLSLPHSRL